MLLVSSAETAHALPSTCQLHGWVAIVSYTIVPVYPSSTPGVVQLKAAGDGSTGCAALPVIEAAAAPIPGVPTACAWTVSICESYFVAAAGTPVLVTWAMAGAALDGSVATTQGSCTLVVQPIFTYSPACSF